MRHLFVTQACESGPPPPCCLPSKAEVDSSINESASHRALETNDGKMHFTLYPVSQALKTFTNEPANWSTHRTAGNVFQPVTQEICRYAAAAAKKPQAKQVTWKLFCFLYLLHTNSFSWLNFSLFLFLLILNMTYMCGLVLLTTPERSFSSEDREI